MSARRKKCSDKYLWKPAKEMWPDWNKIRKLVTLAIYKGYVRGLQDYRDNTISLNNLREENEKFNEILKAHYYE